MIPHSLNFIDKEVVYEKDSYFFLAVVIVICAAVMGFLTFGNSQKGSVEIVEDKSYLSDFEVQDGETRINCVLTFKNTSVY